MALGRWRRNTAIFTIRAWRCCCGHPFDYPKPDQLMYLTAEFSGHLGAPEMRFSEQEYTEGFRQMNQVSFAAVGAYSTGRGEA